MGSDADDGQALMQRSASFSFGFSNIPKVHEPTAAKRSNFTKN